MKTTFTLWALFLFAFCLSAQPTIDDVEPEIGDYFTYDQYEMLYDPGDDGADVTWDYSDLGTPDFIADYTVELPENGSGSENFPDATQVWVIDLDGLFDLNFYMNFTSEAFEENGYYNSYEDATTILNWSNPYSRFTSPINYLDELDDDYEGTLEVVDVLSYPVSGDVSHVADAWGSLSVPGATFDNVLRIHGQETQLDEIVEGFPNVTTRDVYLYYTTSFPMPVIVIEHSETSFGGKVQDESYVLDFLSSYNGSPLGITELNQDLAISLFPNPSSDIMQIRGDFQGMAELRILSLDGKQVQYKQVNNIDEVDVSSLSVGYYLAELRSEGRVFVEKISIVR